MRFKKILLRFVGAIFLLVAIINLAGLAMPELRAHVISLPAISIRYLFFLAAGLGLILLRKWGVYAVVAGVVVNWILFIVVYGARSSAFPIWISLLGPLLLGALFFYSWAALR
ncbi:MAG: hypothetical protein B7Y41_06025 [Hydrogenophilales bacterium 28-61-23]|nr:MAG: hypothetical protein B7Y41_06025 [Hydrogenophilales bacterium 28-61-23]